jgi:hypothetical protein
MPSKGAEGTGRQGGALVTIRPGAKDGHWRYLTLLLKIPAYTSGNIFHDSENLGITRAQ